MPCFLTQQIRVDLSKVPKEHVLQAMRDMASENLVVSGEYVQMTLRYSENVTYSRGKLTVQARTQERAREIENEIKRGIGTSVLKAAAKKFRWTLKAGSKPNEYVTEKRGF